MTDEYSRHIKAGTVIFSEGEPGDCAYIIQKGQVELAMLRGGENVPFSILEKGDLFGEMALIDNSLRTARATAITDTDVLVIQRSFIEQKIEVSDPTVRLLLQVILERYRDVHARLNSIINELGLHNSSNTGLIGAITASYKLIRKGLRYAVGLQPKKDSRKNIRVLKDVVSTSKNIIKESTIKNALDNNEFEMYYQPIVSIATQQIKGCEALIRWNSPTLGFVSPAEFIPLAEQTGIIVDLGQWITDEACRAAGEFKTSCDIYMSINLSTKQLESGQFTREINDIVSKHEIDSNRIKLEITESILMSNPELAASSLHSLTESGFSIAIDDFGTGYSSFSYLHRFPIDTLKIDRSFVNAMFSNEKSMEIVRTLSLLAQNLGMKTIAEGIEQKKESLKLGEFGCDFGQGYLFSRPVPHSEFITLLANENR